MEDGVPTDSSMLRLKWKNRLRAISRTLTLIVGCSPLFEEVEVLCCMIAIIKSTQNSNFHNLCVPLYALMHYIRGIYEGTGC